MKQEERFKEYRRFCKRCGNIYRTFAKRSKLCDKCKIKYGRGKALMDKRKSEVINNVL